MKKKKKSLLLWTNDLWHNNFRYKSNIDSEKPSSPYLPFLRNHRKYVCGLEMTPVRVKVTIEDVK